MKEIRFQNVSMNLSNNVELLQFFFCGGERCIILRGKPQPFKNAAFPSPWKKKKRKIDRKKKIRARCEREKR